MADQSNIAEYKHIAQDEPENQKRVSHADCCLINVDINIYEYLRALQCQNDEKRQKKKHLEVGESL